jgi:hypothetical protein
MNRSLLHKWFLEEHPGSDIWSSTFGEWLENEYLLLAEKVDKLEEYKWMYEGLQ